jgi:hypothetical protein
MTKIDPRWGPNMMQRSGLEAQQVRCLTGDAGAEWVHGLDELPSPVRRRLAESRHNVCPVCIDNEAHSEATRRGLRRPTITVYFDVITMIERKLDSGTLEPRG